MRWQRNSKAYGVCDLLHGFDVIARNELIIGVEKLNSRLFERPLCQQETLDTRQTLVRIIVRLLDECKLLALGLIQATLDGISFLQLFQSKYQELGVVFVGKRTKDGFSKSFLQMMKKRRTGME